jgi:hypothetical protein
MRHVTDRQPQPPPAALTNGQGPALAVSVSPEALRPLVRAIVAEVLAAMEADRAALPDKIAFSEQEAARLLSLNVWQVRDARRRGEIVASQLMCRKVRYTRDDLLRYLAERRIGD